MKQSLRRLWSRQWSLPRWVILNAGLLLLALVAWWDTGDSRVAGHSAESSAGLSGLFVLSRGFTFLDAELGWSALAASAETVAIAVVSTGIGTALGMLLGMGATKSGGARRNSFLHRALRAFSRLILDLLRALPDFAWALVVLTFLGAGPVTGCVALGLSNAGILGRLYSEQWESLRGPTRNLANSVSDSRLIRYLYVHRSVFAPVTRSYTALRLECSVRNASVIGVVGGGGLGGQIFEAFGLGQLGRAAVYLACLCVLTAGTEYSSSRIQALLAQRRGQWLSWAALAGALLWLSPAMIKTGEELGRLQSDWVLQTALRFLKPDLSFDVLVELVQECVLPVALAYVSTIIAVFVAVAFVLPLTRRRLSDWGWTIQNRWQRLSRRIVATAGRWLGLLARTFPVEALVLICALRYGLGVKAALLALTIHSAGLLVRLFYDVLEQWPTHELQHRGLARRWDWFWYVVLPQLWPRWRSFVFFQGDSNLRSGIVLGMIGVGGIGDRFSSALSFWQIEKAATCVLMMLLLSMLSDRFARFRAQKG